MITYQEFLEAIDKGEKARFIESSIRKHQSSEDYVVALDAENYMKKRNTTVCAFQRLIYDIAGRAKVDPVSANFKCASGYFKQIVSHLVQHLLANGVSFNDPTTKAKLGGAYVDDIFSDIARNASVEGVAFAFLDFDRLRVFKLSEFVPMWDEETGALMAGIRFWQLAGNKPLRADVYTVEGVQSYIKRKGEELKPMEGNENPRPYGLRLNQYATGEVEILGSVNYPSLPVVPFYSNDEHQSEIIGLKENIDAYDLTKSGLIDDISDMPLVYWTLENAGGMSEADLAFWKDRINRNKVSMTDDDVKVTANSIGVPYEAQETMLTRLEKDIYADAMALNTRELAAGNVTATAIRAASEPLRQRTNELEKQMRYGIKGLLDLLGIDDEPHFVFDTITNQLEVTEMVMMAADIIDDDTKRRKLPWLTPEECDAIPDKLAAEAMDRATADFSGGNE